MKKHHPSKHYVICVKNRGYEVSLERRKVYPLLSDHQAATRGMVRVIDESGESYLYPEDFFVSIKLPHIVQKVFARAA